jgi:membrane protein DedA with SNARE-associated domain
VSAAIGPDRLRRIVERFGRFLGVSPTDLRRAEEWFDRRAAIAVFAGRCVPIIRSVVSVPAGFRRMTLVPFVLYTALGSAIWNVALIGAGAVLGDQWERVEAYVSYLQWVVILAAAYFLVRFAVRIARTVRSR